MLRKSTSAATIVIGLAGLIGVGAVAAVAARTAASPLELVFHARHEPVPGNVDFPLGVRHTGTFTSEAPFCGSGTAVDLRHLAGGTAAIRRYTCDDGSGSLTLSIANLPYEHTAPFAAGWTIMNGTGRYEGLRGKGTYKGEILGGTPADPLTIVFRTTSQGFADADAVAPTIAIPTAKATKLHRPAGAYLIQLVLSLKDDIDGNPVAYTLRTTGGGLELSNRTGQTVSGSASITLRIRPASKRVRSVRLQLTATDPVGNETTSARTLKLPR